MGTDNKPTPQKQDQFGKQQQAEEPAKSLDKDPERRQAGDPSDTEPTSAGKKLPG